MDIFSGRNSGTQEVDYVFTGFILLDAGERCKKLLLTDLSHMGKQSRNFLQKRSKEPSGKTEISTIAQKLWTLRAQTLLTMTKKY